MFPRKGLPGGQRPQKQYVPQNGFAWRVNRENFGGLGSVGHEREDFGGLGSVGHEREHVRHCASSMGYIIGKSANNPKRKQSGNPSLLIDRNRFLYVSALCVGLISAPLAPFFLTAFCQSSFALFNNFWCSVLPPWSGCAFRDTSR